MKIELEKELASKVKELAKDMGMTDSEVVNKIVEWYFQDNEKYYLCNEELLKLLRENVSLL